MRSHSQTVSRGGLQMRGAFALLSIFASVPKMARAFTGTGRQHKIRCNIMVRQPGIRDMPARPLLMSSIGHDDNDNRRKEEEKSKFSWRDVLPPAPEDQLALSGDIGSLFLYSFLDHSLNDMYVDMINSQDYVVPSTAGAAGSFDGDAAAAAAHTQLPVWYDAAHSAFGPLTTKVLPVMHAAYAPAISTAGGAAVLLSTAWLVSGYVTGAFLYRNTLECSTSRALWVAGRTWVIASAIMVAVALFSDQFQGLCDCVRTPSLGGLTNTDGEFIFSSLSVLVAWRYILSSMLGYGER
uniref:Uncharacterized protein n=1 Tax=Odontella aurita TaxID=265563 RepID=A0A7S4J6U1_9STRA|mmetsp:Transcript_40184/g.121109  ORF Transcript_40184/g.121109 Transcript_40184/m.121109 type:complete len:295 (+) Transcript_40184:259-1143(+)